MSVRMSDIKVRSLSDIAPGSPCFFTFLNNLLEMIENNMPFIFQAADCNDRRHVGRGEAAGAGWAGRGGGG